MPEVSASPTPAGVPLMRIMSDPNDIWQDYAAFFFAVTAKDGRYFAKPLEFNAPEPPHFNGIEERKPVFTICRKSPEGQVFMQRLMDDLWALGYRPTDMGTPGHLAATTKHLEDMRALAAKALDVKLP